MGFIFLIYSLLADDTLLFSNYYMLNNLKNVVVGFEMMLGLKISLSKSFLAGSNVDENEVSIVAPEWGCTTRVRPLWLAMGSSSLDPGIDVRIFWDRIFTWRLLPSRVDLSYRYS